MMEPNSALLFRCTLCSQSFKQKADLAEHMLVHFGQKKHACHLCGKKFFNEKSLELHIKIHTTEIKYEALSTASEQHLALPSQASSVAGNHQVKVRVKSFPANANAKRAKLAGSPSGNVMHFRLNKEELDVIEESEVYTSQGDIQEQVFEENAHVQLKVWSNTQKDEQMLGASDDIVGQSSYVIKVQNKTVETPRPVSSNALKMNVNKAQSQEPIRIFVGSNIHVEDISDLQQQLSSQLAGFRNDDESQRMQTESVYFCDTSEDTLHHTEYQHQLLQDEEEIDDELDRLKEEMVDGDLQPLSEEMDDLHSLQEETDDDDDDDMPPFHEMNDNFRVTDGRVGYDEAVMKDLQVSQEDISKGLAGRFDRDFGNSKGRSTIDSTETSLRESSQKIERSSLLHKLAESVPVTSETHMQEEEKEVDCDSVQMQQENAGKQVKIVSTPDACTGDVKSNNEKMDSSDSLREQIMRSSEKPHKCHICGLGFRFSFYLNAHLPVHSKEKVQYECDKCNKSFKLPEVYNDHLRLHEDQKMPRCCVCSKEHKNSDEAKCCVDTHMQEKHVCPVCLCSFFSSKRLKSHMKTHVEHKCYICDKIFQDHSKLNRHMVSHRNKKLYHCDICNRTIYCLPSEVQRHKALHKNVVSCPVCSMEFISQEPLLNHMKKRHWRRKFSGFSKNGNGSRSEDEINSEGLPLADNQTVGSDIDCENDRDVRRKVASLLIEELLQDMFEEEFDESFDECEPLNWLENISEGLTKDKFIECIGKCRTKHDVLREMSFYSENDIIKDAVSDCMLKERICLQKISQMMKASEQLLGKSVFVRKNSQKK